MQLVVNKCLGAILRGELGYYSNNKTLTATQGAHAFATNAGSNAGGSCASSRRVNEQRRVMIMQSRRRAIPRLGCSSGLVLLIWRSGAADGI